jgi:ankyrin repeat protein
MVIPRELINIRAIKEKMYMNPLGAAIAWGHEDIAVELVKQIFDEDETKAASFMPPLYLAVLKGMDRVVFALLIRGLIADLGLPLFRNKTPLDVAIQCGTDNVSVVNLLQAAVYPGGDSHEYPWYDAAICGNLATAVFFLEVQDAERDLDDLLRLASRCV